MVYNKGGNKGKKCARKNTKGGGYQGKMRKSECSEEIYAAVTKILGNGRVEVICNDGETRHCVIRKSFRGRRKRDNEVFQGTIVLVGIRDWATKNLEKKEVCDLLFVYDNSHINKLKNEPDINMSLLQKSSETTMQKFLNNKSNTTEEVAIINSEIENDEVVDFFDRGVESDDQDEDVKIVSSKESIININEEEEIDVGDI